MENVTFNVLPFGLQSSKSALVKVLYPQCKVYEIL